MPRPIASGLALAAVYLFWGSTFAGMRVAVQTLPPWFIGGTRHLAAGLLLAVFAFGIARQRPTWRNVKTSVISGFLLLVLGNGLVVWSVQYLPSSIAAFLVSATPVWIAIIDFALYRNAPTRAGVFGLILGLCGVFVLVYDAHATHAALWPAVLTVIASVAWAIGTIYQRQSRGTTNLLSVTTMQMITGGIILLAMSFAAGEPARVHPSSFTTATLLAYASLILLGSLVGYVCYLWLVKNVATPVLATYAYVNPLVAAVLGIVLLHEVLTPRVIIAGAIILGGVILMIVAPRRRSDPKDFGATKVILNADSPKHTT